LAPGATTTFSIVAGMPNSAFTVLAIVSRNSGNPSDGQ